MSLRHVSLTALLVKKVRFWRLQQLLTLWLVVDWIRWPYVSVISRNTYGERFPVETLRLAWLEQCEVNMLHHLRG
jgi:hypothetical protein